MKYYPYNNFKDWDADSNSAKPDPEQPFWMVIRIGSCGMNKSDSMPTFHHSNFEDARAEAERLARKHPNHENGFAVVKTECIFKGLVDVQEITWGNDAPAKNRRNAKQTKKQEGEA